MSLFSSPAFRVFNSENSDSIVARKPGNNTLTTRKPFVDRTVNCNTPDVHKKQKCNIPIKENVKTSSPIKTTENLEIDPENHFSYKDVEDEFEDLVPYSKRLEEHHFFNIVKSFLNENTPPPSPTFMDATVEVPELDVSYDSSFHSNKSYDDDMFYKLPETDNLGFEHIDEVDLPAFDIDNL